MLFAVMGQTDGEKGSLNRRREQMMKSHSMEALETPTPSVNGDANEPDAPDGRRLIQRQGCEDTQENHQQNASQHFHKQEKHVKRRHRWDSICIILYHLQLLLTSAKRISSIDLSTKLNFKFPGGQIPKYT